MTNTSLCLSQSFIFSCYCHCC
uniref:Uncharacterized protein n=1 Tax=Salix viminalis TaxID=40686 RepID=A0A6N2K637_SALVM